MMISFKTIGYLVTIILFSLLALPWSLAYADKTSSMENAQVIQAFAEHVTDKPGVQNVADNKKRLVMFILGVPLLLCIVITGVLGIAMGVYGKQVFVAHMIFAGLSITLAIAHAIVGIAWFLPF